METKVEQLRKRNYRKIKELIGISFSLGVNLTAPSLFKDSLKIINVILTVGSIYSLYGHWCYTKRYIEDLSIIAEVFYFLGFLTSTNLKNIIQNIMEKNWKDIRGQLLFYICACSAIISNYFFSAVFGNMYHDIKKTPNYVPKWPFPALYPMWEDKGMSFPYYQIQMFLGFCGDYIGGICAASFDGVFIVLCVHGVGLIQVLNAMIEYSTSCEVPKESRVQYLRYCILTYQRINDYLLTLQSIYRQISLSQFFVSLFVWGIVAFQMSLSVVSNKITFMRMILFILASGYQIVLYCYNSDRLTTESQKIPLAFYNCEWYNESEEFKQLIQMMILRSNRVFKLNISWFATMSLPTLLAMVKNNASYFLLLRNLSN